MRIKKRRILRWFQIRGINLKKVHLEKVICQKLIHWQFFHIFFLVTSGEGSRWRWLVRISCTCCKRRTSWRTGPSSRSPLSPRENQTYDAGRNDGIRRDLWCFRNRDVLVRIPISVKKCVPTYFIPSYPSNVNSSTHLFRKIVFFSKIYFGKLSKNFGGMFKFSLLDDEAQIIILTLHGPSKNCFPPVSKIQPLTKLRHTEWFTTISFQSSTHNFDSFAANHFQVFE
jgi:hypothetical protein